MIATEYLPSLYMPIDRWHGLANGLSLPEYTTGTALIADISGYTMLTETLITTLGTRRGTEALTQQINLIYTALITEVHRYHGSVIGFSGDAITCWFDGLNQPEDQAATRAISCAQAMQRAMGQFSALTLPNCETIRMCVKTALATGPARRLQVGNPADQLLDVLAGATLQRMARAEHAANPGEIVVDMPTALLLADRMFIQQWRLEGDPGEPSVLFAVIDGLADPCPPIPWEIPPSLPPHLARPWLLSALFDRLRAGLGDNVTELRSMVAVFLRFSGIDYDQNDAAGEQLNAYIHWVQSVLAEHTGILINMTIGDKGSYLFAAFGQSASNEQNAIGAVRAAITLCRPPPRFQFMPPVQVGISAGIMQIGSCGGELRRTYTILGDGVNLAARLMENALPGTALANRNVQLLTRDEFDWKLLPSIQVKGKRQAIRVASPYHRKNAGAKGHDPNGQRRTFRNRKPHSYNPYLTATDPWDFTTHNSGKPRFRDTQKADVQPESRPAFFSAYHVAGRAELVNTIGPPP